MNTHLIRSQMNKAILFLVFGVVLGSLLFGTKARAFNKSVLHNNYTVGKVKSRGRGFQKVTKSAREQKWEKFSEKSGIRNSLGGPA